jgi:hypothetical protein
MYAMLSPDKKPARPLAFGLLAVVSCSALLALLQAGYGDLPRDPDLSGPALMAIAGVFGAFGGFFSVLSQSLLIWVYGRAAQSSDPGFVRTLAVVALALGAALLLGLVVSGTELLMTGMAPATPATNLSRYLGPGFEGVDLSNLVSIAIVYAGSKRYLGYGPVAAAVLALLMLAISLMAGALV